MKYYSEVTQRLYNTEKELHDAETKVKLAEEAKKKAEVAKTAERATRAKEVEAALKEANTAQSKAIKLLKEFTKDYGYFHTSFEASDDKDEEESLANDFFDIFHSFLK